MKNILNIMKYDIIAMGAKKFSLGKAILIAAAVFAAMGLFFPPMLLGLLVTVGFIAVQAFIDIEDKSEGEMTFAVLPVSRKENVIARYGLITIIITATGAVSLILLKISQLLNLSDFFIKTPELNESLSTILDLRTNDVGIFFMLLCFTLSVSLVFSAAQLSNYFKTGKNKARVSVLKLTLIMFVCYLCFGAIILFEASTLQVKILSSAIEAMVSLFIALSTPYNGALLGIFVILIGYGFLFYKAACSVIDYESREL